MQQPWTKTAEQVLLTEASNPQTGLSQAEAKRRLQQFGPNQLVKERTTSFWAVFKEEIAEPMILLLLVVGIVYSVWGDVSDAITIFAIIIALVFVEIFTEYRAKRAIAALKRLSPLTNPVMREGMYMRIPSSEVTRGDIVLLEAGEKVPADARIIESFGLQVDESSLTGESSPVAKGTEALPDDIPMAERANMVFAGTTATKGRGRVVVTATGMDTEMGKITGLVLEAKEPKTPLQLAMKQLAGLLVWIAVFFSVLIPAVGIIQGKPYQEMILTGLSMSFATIPEELPIIITMVLGVGAFALSRKNVLIRRLRTAETLGGVTVIVTDKTGTITENKMSLAEIAAGTTSSVPSEDRMSRAESSLLKIGAITSCLKKATEGCYLGDPLEIALLEGARAAGISPEELQEQYNLKREFTFDNERKMMSAIFQRDSESFVYAKGAPEIILARSSSIAQGSGERNKTEVDEEEILARAGGMAAKAMRVIAFAYKKIDDGAELTQEEAESDLVFLGLAGLVDPPRAGVAEALRATKEAGIRTMVVSGDHPLTVQRVASEVGIDSNGKVITGVELDRIAEKDLPERVKEVSLFARTSPEQKLRIVNVLQGAGEVVAVTGDGTNDAPALKSADIGIAMGETGTEVAREAAAMVLTDDSFISIVAGVREGRKIFDNLKKGVSYYLSVKVALVLSFLIPLILGIPFPFAPIQIVLLELFMDLAASATFVAEPMEPDTMQRPPRPRSEKFIDRSMLTNIFLGSLSLAAAVLINYTLAWYAGWGLVIAQSVAFGTWLVGHIFLALTMRSQRQSLWEIGLLSNRIMLLWAAAALAFLVLVTSIPSAQGPLRVTSLNPLNWFLIIAVPFVTIFWLELKKFVTHH